MGHGISEDALKEFAVDFSEDIRAASSGSGEIEELEMLNIVKEKLGECKTINDPQFFYWSLPYEKSRASLYGYDIDEFDSSVSLFMSDFGDPMHTILQKDAQRMIDEALNFIRFSIKGTDKVFEKLLENEVFDLYDQILQLNKTAVGITKIKVILVSNGKQSSRSRIDLSPIGNIDVELQYWDIVWINANCNASATMEDIIIDANDEEYSSLMEKGLPCLPVPQVDNTFECYQCVVPGKLLSNVYRKYGSRLLEGNVRSFLTTKTSVNKEIQGTINKCPARFYVYNNGIAAIASSVVVEKVDGSQHITRIENIQIVNGGQTTASLAYSEQKRGVDLSLISVPMKLTVIKVDNDEKKEQLGELIQKISETSNSQNKVSAADFFSNHPFHLKIKKFSETLSQPGPKHPTYWFYERVRGEYDQSIMLKPKKEQDIFKQRHPKEQKMTKSDFAKFYYLKEKQPDLVSQGETAYSKAMSKEINANWETDQSKYNELYFKENAAVCRIYRTLEPLVTKKNLEWFSGSYRAQILAYAIASFFLLLERDNKRFNFTAVWDRGLTDNAISELLSLSHFVYEVLTDPSRQEENVTQYAKKKYCWDTMKNRIAKYHISYDAIQPYIIDLDEYIAQKKEAKSDQELTDEVNAFGIVTKPPYRKHWMSLMQYLCDNRNLFPELTDSGINTIMKVVNMDNGKMGSSFPSGKDCLESIKWWNEAEKMGWVIK